MDEDQESDNDFFDCVEDIDDLGKFYAVALPQDKWTERKGLIAVDFEDAMKKLKEIKGARLKVFQKISEAERFANTPAESLVSPQSKDKTRMRRDVDPFPNVSQRDLNEFRLSIDRGDLKRVEEMVWNNPRHLVNESDFPTVLQVRFRYNAVHNCCYRGQAHVLRRVLAILDSSDFWRTLHPTVDEMTHSERRRRLLDLFLNSPDTGCLETPLHFASKFGHVDCVRAVVEHEQSCLEPRNREGRTPAELVCSRCPAEPDRTERRRNILDILQGQFVLLVEPDGCSGAGYAKVLPPCGWREYQSWRSRGGSGLRAFAGPMGREEAGQFHRLLSRPVRKLARLASCSLSQRPATASTGGHSPNSSLAEFEVFSAKLADSEKGYERVGRHLAAKLGLSWSEYWPFLGDFVDLASDAGLAALEEHVRRQGAAPDPVWGRYRQVDDEESLEEASLSAELSANGSPGLNSNNSNCEDVSWLSPISKLFAKLSVRSPSAASPPPEPPFPSPIAAAPPTPEAREHAPLPCSTSTPRRPATARRPPRRSLSGRADGVGRVDVHVYRALEPLTPERLDRFPRLRQWRQEVAEEVTDLSASPRRSNSWHQALGRVT